MSLSRLRLRLACAGLSVVLGLLGSPDQGFAATASLKLADVDFVNGNVTLSVDRDACDTATTVQLSEGATGSLVATMTFPSGAQRVAFDPVRLIAPTVYQASGLAPSGEVVWTAGLALDPATLGPGQVSAPGLSKRVVGTRRTVSGHTERPLTTIDVRILQTGRAPLTLTSASVPATGFSISDVPVAGLGAATIEILAKNAFGASQARYRVYRLGTRLPKTRRYAFICRRTLWMYFVQDGVVVRRWPVAIGTRQTPTPAGTYKIGKPTPGGGSWGALRRRLWRLKDGRRVKTQYFIHGTNEPWSIGTKASFGCVRMYNKDVRTFARQVRTSTIIVIR